MAPHRLLALLVLCCQHVHFHAMAKVKELKQDADLRVEPQEAIVLAGTNVSFTCLHPRNTTFLWNFSSKIQAYEEVQGLRPDNSTFYSRITFFGASRFMSGEILCSVDEGASKALGFLIVNGVQMGGACHNSTDCITDQAICQNHSCQCPRNFVRLRLTEGGYDVCREMIYSLYDPCEFNEQCSHLVDPKSICSSVCVCAPYAKDRKGTCILLNEISTNRSQEMYRVGLIAVTCIIILIVAMSLWITLKRTCHEHGSRRTQTDVIYPQSVIIEPTSDKPPSYDDVIEAGDVVTAPPTMKDALTHCMTAKKLLRQVSAPAGQLLPQPGINAKPSCDTKGAAGILK